MRLGEQRPTRFIGTRNNKGGHRVLDAGAGAVDGLLQAGPVKPAIGVDLAVGGDRRSDLVSEDSQQQDTVARSSAA